jgi:hypothetical protein
MPGRLAAALSFALGGGVHRARGRGSSALGLSSGVLARARGVSPHPGLPHGAGARRECVRCLGRSEALDGRSPLQIVTDIYDRLPNPEGAGRCLDLQPRRDRPLARLLWRGWPGPSGPPGWRCRSTGGACGPARGGSPRLALDGGMALGPDGDEVVAVDQVVVYRLKVANRRCRPRHRSTGHKPPP